MRSTVIALALTVAALLPATADAKWTQVRSANFLFVGDASEGQIRRIAQKLEQFREVMLRALPGATAVSPVPTVVMVFATQRSLQPVAPLFRGNPIEVGGYFRQGEDLNYIAIDAEYIDQRAADDLPRVLALPGVEQRRPAVAVGRRGAG